MILLRFAPIICGIKPELIIAIATLILAVVTGWMAMETRRMAIAATRALELEQSPILGFRDLKIDVTPATTGPWQQLRLAAIEVGMELFNAGRLPIQYNIESLEVTFASNTGTFGQFRSRGTTVLPGAFAVFWQPLQLQPPVANFPATGRVRFRFEYSDNAGRQGQPIVGTIEYTVFGATPGRPIRWRHVDEPSTS